ncbi:hypothetical protein [Nostoc sp.]|uniref:hypothetical protein n=1 Tax=Nostoc sp. TaxID=1180 RepID=UPI002FF9EB98
MFQSQLLPLNINHLTNGQDVTHHLFGAVIFYLKEVPSRIILRHNVDVGTFLENFIHPNYLNPKS